MIDKTRVRKKKGGREVVLHAIKKESFGCKDSVEKKEYKVGNFFNIYININIDINIIIVIIIIIIIINTTNINITGHYLFTRGVGESTSYRSLSAWLRSCS